MRWRGLMVAFVIVLTCTGPNAEAVPGPPIALQTQVVDSFVNSVGDPVLYRRGWHAGGGTGFGYEKVTKKHGITNNAVVGAVVRAPQLVRQEGNYWVHEKQAILYKIFSEPETTTVRVIINYGSWSGPGQHGVVTAYCLQDDPRCPDWVNTAFAVD